MDTTPQHPSRRRFLTASAAGIAAAPAFLTGATAPKIKIGQIGTKHAHASGKMNAIRRFPEIYEVVGVVEPDDARWASQSQTDNYKGLQRLTEEQLFNVEGLQAIAVETEVKQLVPTAIRCLKAGVHIHLDKPAGDSLELCKQMHAEADERGVTIQMGYMLRYNPGFQFLYQILQEGWLGEIMEVSGMMGKKMNEGGRKELAQFEGGGMFELACHLIDQVVYVLGPPSSVTAFSHESYPEQDEFADNQLAVFDYPKAIGTIRCNHNDPMGGPRRQFNVTGTEGTFEIRPLEPAHGRLGLSQDRGDYRKGFQDVEFAKPTGRYDEEFLDLAKVIRGEKKLAWDSAHDIAVEEAVLRGSGMLKD